MMAGMTTLTRSTLAASIALSLLSGGCFLLGEGGAKFIEADDVRLDLPGAVSDRDVDPSMIHGDLHDAAIRVTEDVNTWVTSMVETSARVVEYLDRVPETSRDGSTRVYGPYADRDGRDLAWLVRIDESADTTTFELHVGPRAAASQAEMSKLMSGSLVATEEDRSGGFTLDFDVVEKYPEVKGEAAKLYTYAGAVDVTFERQLGSEFKHIDMDLQGLSVIYEGFLDDDAFFGDDTYTYHRAADGSGSFRLALLGEWDDFGWSGPAQENMTLEWAWTPTGEGRTRGSIVEVDGVGDMKHGDLALAECFGADGYLTWRQINDAYLVEAPEYNLGDPKSCALGVDAFDK